MLYNRNWDRQIPNRSGDIWHIDNFIAWLETMHGTYDYFDPGCCLIAQYLKAMGKKQVTVGPNRAYFRKEGWLARFRLADSHVLPDGWDNIAVSNGTFEKALRAAKELRGSFSPEQILRESSELSFAHAA